MNSIWSAGKLTEAHPAGINTHFCLVHWGFVEGGHHDSAGVSPEQISLQWLIVRKRKKNTMREVQAKCFFVRESWDKARKGNERRTTERWSPRTPGRTGRREAGAKVLPPPASAAGRACPTSRTGSAGWRARSEARGERKKKRSLEQEEDISCTGREVSGWPSHHLQSPNLRSGFSFYTRTSGMKNRESQNTWETFIFISACRSSPQYSSSDFKVLTLYWSITLVCIFILLFHYICRCMNTYLWYPVFKATDLPNCGNHEKRIKHVFFLELTMEAVK